MEQLSATTPVWQFLSPTSGWSYPLTEGTQKFGDRKFQVHSNQAAGTVPFHRYRNSNNEYFYSRFSIPPGWADDGIAFYVYPDGSTPETVPLYLFHQNARYFMTTDQAEGGDKIPDNVINGIQYPWAFVLPAIPKVPAAPTQLSWDGYYLDWRDNSNNETAFKIERLQWSGSEYVGIEVATVPVNQPYFKPGPLNIGGNSVFRVRATNGFGNSAYTEAICGCFQEYTTPPNTPPDVDITSPENGDVVDPNIAIFANAFDIEGNGTIVKVEFLADGNKLGEVTDAPYIFVWSNAAPGTHSLTATVTDNAGGIITSTPVNVTVASSNSPPTISITTPLGGTLFTAPATLTINASASDSDGSISKVEFYQGSTKLGEDATAPFSFAWTNVGAGSYSLTARAMDNLSASTTSAATNITVNNNVSPTVSITAPTSGAVLAAPATVNINASASDTDGCISKVEFFQAATKIGEDNTAPYSFSWTSVPAGNYVLTAIATDNGGASSTSGAVSVTVTQSASSQHYQASTDFSGVQGQGNWYYLDSNGTPLTFLNQWGGVWSLPNTSVYLGANWGHPDSADAVRQWRAPVAGSIQITGTAFDTASGGGDGVIVRIKKGSQVLWERTIENGDATGFSYVVTTTVAAGDQINFLINQRGNTYFDSTGFDPAITFTPGQSVTTYRSSTDFSGIQGQGNWYYLDSTGTQLTFLNQWGGVWNLSNTSVFLGGGWGHPGDTTDAVRQWRAPRAGSIRITGTASDSDPGGGDGVIVRIKKGSQVLWERTIQNGDATGFSYDLTTTVAAGDQINFVINQRGNTYWDSTIFDSVIIHTVGGN